jgi:hypothetical protein
MGKQFVFCLTILLSLTSCHDNHKEWVKFEGNDAAEYLQKLIIDDSLYNCCKEGKLIPNEEIAISIAENYLFNLFGKDVILAEKPYRINNIKNCWVIAGTLPRKFTKGGTFVIAINSLDGKVVGVTHYK